MTSLPTCESASPACVAPRARRRLERLEALGERERTLCWFVYSLAFLVYSLMLSSSRRMWYDEMFTYYISRMPLDRMWASLLGGLDQNPPAYFLLTRACMSVFGGELGIRIPSVLGYWATSFLVFRLVRDTASELYAWAAVSFLSMTLAFSYATEGRPYGLLMMFAAAALLCYARLRSEEPVRRRLLRVFLGLSLLGATCCHAYSALLFVPLGLAELTNLWQRRSIDWAMWSALLLPAVSFTQYVPIVLGVQSLTHTWAKPEPLRILQSYAAYFGASWVVLIIALALILCLTAVRDKVVSAEAARGQWTSPVRTALVATAALPVIGYLLGSFTGIFTARYALPAITGLVVLMTVGLYRLTRQPQAACVFILAGVASFVGSFVWLFSAPPRNQVPLQSATAFYGVNPLLSKVTASDLPIVISSGPDFLVLDHYAPAEIARRLSFLIDERAAVEYTNVDLFDMGYPVIRKWVLLRGSIQGYRDFLRAHERFYVYGSWDSINNNDWLVHQLLSDGMTMTALGRFDRKLSWPAWMATSADHANMFLFEVHVTATARSVAP